MAALTPDEAQTRAELLDISLYNVHLDLRGAADPEHGTFTSITTISLVAAHTGETFLDLRAEKVHRIVLDGSEVDAGSLADSRLPLALSAGAHELTVHAEMAYSRDGQGLHRAVDPADGETYLYGHLFLDAAPRVFACFDQPDLKAPFQISVRANPEWAVISNGVIEATKADRVDFAVTKPLATYFVTVCAGPYVSVTGEHRGVPLGVHARASLVAALKTHAPDILDVTRGALDYFEDLFGFDYPFGSYDQVFVPEFNAGAMENPGCVTFRDGLLYRGVATSEDIMGRSLTVAHELAHMWCGDLVTMKWWEDLWLNESFAEYLGHAALAHISDSAAPWVHGSISRKTWGYAAERAPSAHPVAASAADTEAALANFDGISYAKGAAVLRQLVATIGHEAFAAGMKDHIARFAWGNASLADFMDTMERAVAGGAESVGASRPIDIRAWMSSWLTEVGLDALTAAREGNGARVDKVAPGQTGSSRAHLSTVAAWSREGKVWEQELWLPAGTEQAEVATAAESVIVPNAADLTWARVVFDEESLAVMPQVLPVIDDATHRAVIWSALIDGLAQSRVTPAYVTDVVCAALPGEGEPSIVTHLGRFIGSRLVPEYLVGDVESRDRISWVGQECWERASEHGELQIEAARLLMSTTQNANLLHRWRAGWELPAGLANDRDLRWLMLRSLATLGQIERHEIAAEADRDSSLAGRLGALTARAALPGAGDKRWAWAQLTGAGLSNHERNAIGQGFWLSGDPQLLQEYVNRFVRDIPSLQSMMGPDASARLTLLAFPRTLPFESTMATVRASLDCELLSAGVRRSLTDGLFVLGEVWRARARA